MSNLFISHSSRDHVAARELQARLEKEGHRSVFLDLDPDAGIQAGVSWERTLYTKLRACRAVVALCSDTYLASQWCFAEIALARMEGKELFVLQIDPWSEKTKMPSILTEEQFIDLRTNQADGYRRLWNGFKVKGIAAAEAREWKPDEPPYPGLRAFREEHAPIFFGRDAEIREAGELLNRVRRQGHPRMVMVLGSSGSGKSSLVRAGMVPQLRRDRAQWLVVKPFRPGQQPARELAAALSQAFTEAGQTLAWEEIHRLLEPPGGGGLVAPEPDLRATTEPSPAAARQRLLEALSAMEGELTAADENVVSSLHRLKDYLGKPPARATQLEASPSSLASPLAELAFRLRLQSGAAEATVVLVIDQFEELLGHEAAHPATRFLATLRTAMEAGESPLLVIGTMRSDYLGMLQRSAPLQGLGFGSLSVGPVSKDGMRQIIEEPARLGQIQLENGLTDLLIADTETADALPLLAFTLRMMWDRFRENRTLEKREYAELGGLQGAVAQVADETLESALKLGEERDLRDAFLRLARPAGEGWARQATSWDQLADRVRPMLQLFIDQRLLVKRADGTVEVAHEALFRSWEKLRGWLRENAEGLRLLRDIQIDAEKWQNAATDEEKEPFMWRGGRLARAIELRDGGVLPLTDIDRSFIEASHRAERATLEAEEARRQRELAAAQRLAEAQQLAAGRLRKGLIAAVALIILSLAAGAYGWRQATNARRTLSQSDFLRATDFLAGKKTLEALTFLARACRTDPDNGAAATRLFSLLAQRNWVLPTAEPIAIPGGEGDSPALEHIAFCDDGTVFAVTNISGKARIFDAASGRLLLGPVPCNTNRFATNVERAPMPDQRSFSAQNRLVLIAEGKEVRIGDLTTGKVREPVLAHTATIFVAQFSPDGSTIVTADEEGNVVSWNSATGTKIADASAKLPHAVRALSRDGSCAIVASAPQAAHKQRASGDEMNYFRELNSFNYFERKVAFGVGWSFQVFHLKGRDRPPSARGVANPGNFLALSDDGQHVVFLASGEEGRTLHLANAGEEASAEDSKLALLTNEHNEHIEQMEHIERVGWTADSRHFITAGIVWRPPHEPHEDGAPTLEIGQMRAWNVGLRKEVAQCSHSAFDVDMTDGFQPYRAAWDTPLRRIASLACHDRALRVTAARNGSSLNEPPCSSTPFTAVGLHPSGTLLLTGSADGTAQMWDIRPTVAIRELLSAAEFVQPDPSVRDPRGKREFRAVSRSAAGGKDEDDMLQLIDVASGKPIVPSVTIDDSDEYRFSPDGQRLLIVHTGTSMEEGQLRIHNATTGALLREQRGATGGWFNPNGDRVLIATYSNLTVFDLATDRELIDPLPFGEVQKAALTADGLSIPDNKGDIYRFQFQLERAPELLAELAEAVAQHALNEAGIPERRPRTIAQIRALGAKLNERTAPPHFVAWLKWFLAPRESRPIAPGSKKTMREYVRQLIEKGDEESLNEAEMLVFGDKAMQADIEAKRAPISREPSGVAPPQK